MKTFKEIKKMAEKSGIPKQSVYQIYIKVGSKPSRPRKYTVAGMAVFVVEKKLDYRWKHGASSNRHRWVYSYQCGDFITNNYKSILSYLYHNQ